MEDSKLNRRKFLNQSLITSITAISSRRMFGANDRVSIGIIGCGARNLLKEVLEFSQDTNVEVTAVCDTWRQQREKAVAMIKEASGKEPQQFVHYQDLLAMKGVDAVVIGTPDHQHCRMLTAAARAGKDAYVEKPLAMEMKELIEAVDSVKRYQRIVQCGTQVRSYPSAAAARAFVTSGGLGRILKVEQSRNSYRPYWHQYGERPVRESDVDWKAFLMHRKYRPFDADQYAGWFGYREFSRGPHSNLMVHFIDLVHYITGATVPKRAVTLGGTYRWKDARTAPDSIETIFEYPDEGFLVRYNTTFGTSAGSYLKFFGTRGVLDASRWSWTEPFQVSGEGSGEPDRIEPGTGLPTLESTPHMKNWLECLRNRKPPNAPIEAGYAHSVAVIMADEAYVRGARMVYDPVKRSMRQG
ncbi:MAG: Gfo/Idh/MocA family oxidoreductase [Acidobacteria bacterium]|nr:Gfo/Idh/MocA family oxidoreductase [Acidobacteriota bacterium]MCI0721958.1 Gfo/Idh/MocA family oxidoreductase [Acidobacteriota bacterium]